MSTTAALVTIGDELLAGVVENTNASWLAAELTERGVDVQEVRTIPDERACIARTVAELERTHAFVITTGGLGSTPDDVTLNAVADATERSLEEHVAAREHVEEAVADVRKKYPEFRHDIDAASQYPAGATIVPNDEGISPGCICGNVYVLPGIPEEMKAVFRRIEDEFNGAMQSRVLYSDVPESHLNALLDEVRKTFDVRVGCYPTEERRRIRLGSDDEDALERAHDWMAGQSEIHVPEYDDASVADRTR